MNSIKRFFDKDQLVFGAVLGIAIPALAFALIIGLSIFLMDFLKVRIPVSTDVLGFIAVAANLLPFRWYMVNKRYEQTGKGVLLITFIFAFINVVLVLGAEEGWF